MLDEAGQRIRESGGDGVTLDVDELERQEDVEAAFRRAVDGLGKLKRDMPSVVARMQRAKDAGEYVMVAGR